MRARVPAIVAVVLVALVGPSAAPSPAQVADGSGLVLVSQTPTVEPGSTFDVRLLLSDAAADADEIRLVAHDRIRSRSELTSSSAGTGLRRALHTVDAPVDQLPSDGGGVHLSLSLDPTTEAGRALATPGVYPIELLARAADRSLARVVTHLVVRPPTLEDSPPLSVAVVVAVGAPPTPAPGTSPLGADAIATTAALLDTISSGASLATLAATPETLEALAASPSPEATALVEQLRVVATRQPVLALPYVAVSPDALGAANLPAELTHQLERGRQVQREVLQADTTERRVARFPELAARGLALLEGAGVSGVILDADNVDPATDGLLSLARPFLLGPPRGRTSGSTGTGRGRLEGFAEDSRLAEVLDEDADPAVLASRVMAELAMLWFEQPGIARAVVVPLDRSVDPSASQRILDGLQVSTLFRPVPLDDVFTAATPLTDRDGDRVQRPLDPAGDAGISSGDVGRLRDLLELRGSVRSMVGEDSALLRPIDAALLKATALGLETDERDAQLDEARAAIDAVADAITARERFTITLTARSGTVPLTIRNDTGAPVEVRVRLRGPRLDLPGGETLDLTLAEGTTRRDIAVRTRTSGAIPLEVDVVSPDGGIVLASTRYSVRSTAVSGVGLFLSAGAGLFLVIWWARHWRQARRSAKLVASPHPMRRPDAD